MLSINHNEAMTEYYKQDKEYCIALLNDIISDNEQSYPELLITLNRLSKAFDNSELLTKNSNIDETKFDFFSILAILKSINLKFSITA